MVMTVEPVKTRREQRAEDRRIAAHLQKTGKGGSEIMTPEHLTHLKSSVQELRAGLEVHGPSLAQGLVPREFSRRKGLVRMIGGLALIGTSLSLPMESLTRVFALTGGVGSGAAGLFRYHSQAGENNAAVLQALGLKVRRTWSPKNILRKPLPNRDIAFNRRKIAKWLERSGQLLRGIDSIAPEVQRRHDAHVAAMDALLKRAVKGTRAK